MKSFETKSGGPGSGSRDPRERHEAEEIGKILSRWLSRNRIRDRIGDGSIFGRWGEIVGEEISSLTRPVRVADGILTVQVSSAPLLTELATYRREEILRAVRARSEFEGIREIRFRPG